ncbi:prepilin peptidase [Alkalilimnicola ehrlichii MLHE-1]|uniref:Prepilin leader peptidase/N-methyltransferase n=1 Tax=Alkalilimnicola ehrlichii (strain ATCC BAA-1101 / DSM 17681 / MLHE-1) TaxID=187272 RepID=Q0A6W4_ALKEH|nr:A24 family peptidase [Alkalilimnicola ehrlichii]ABI57423.1 type 4 prepilin peptidase 1 [Alkalilimnicola ehrlichii MLHE-1]
MVGELNALLADNAPLAAALALVLGLLVGSFLNVVILRLPIMMERAWASEVAASRGEVHEDAQSTPFNLVTPRSHCPQCGHTLSALENIPVVSWLLLRGRCRACGTRISGRYPLVELTTGLLSALVVLQLGWTPETAAALLLTWTLVALSGIDLDHQLLPDSLTLPLLWAGLLVNSTGLFAELTDAVWGAALGYLVLWGVFHAFRLLTGKEGMGYGDFKLLAALGAWLGWQALPLIILLSSLVGAAVGIALIALKGRGREVPIPFGPYIAAAGFITLLWGEALVHWYFRASGLA